MFGIYIYIYYIVCTVVYMSYPIPSTLFSSELTVLQEEVMIYEVVDRMPEGSLRGRNPSKLPKNNGTSKTCFTT